MKTLVSEFKSRLKVMMTSVRETKLSVFALASVFRFWLKLVFLTSSNNGPGETGREGEVDGDDELGVPSRLRKSGSC